MRVVALTEYLEWFAKLERREQREVERVVLRLETFGRALAQTPLAKPLRDAGDVWELRPVVGRSGVRVLFALEPHDSAVLLLGIAKTEPRAHARRVARALRLLVFYRSRTP